MTNNLVLPAGVSTTSFPLSNNVSYGSSFSSLTSANVNLLTNTGIPFHAIYITSPGGISPTSHSIYVSLSYLFQPFNLPITAIAYILANDNNPP